MSLRSSIPFVLFSLVGCQVTPAPEPSYVEVRPEPITAQLEGQLQMLCSLLSFRAVDTGITVPEPA